MTPETLAEAILSAAGSGLRHYKAGTLAAILDTAAEQIALIRAADPRNIAQDGRNGAVATLASSGVDNGPHGAENGGDCFDQSTH